MAGKNSDKGKKFLSFIEDEFQSTYLSDFPGTYFGGFENTNLDPLVLENSGQNFSLEFNRGPGQGVQFLGFGQTSADINQANNNGANVTIPQHYTNNNNNNVASSSKPPSVLTSRPSESPSSNTQPLKATDLLVAVSISSEDNKYKIFSAASEAMDELRAIAMFPGEPLWQLDLDKNITSLNNVEYLRDFANVTVTMMELQKLLKDKYEPLPRMWPRDYSGFRDPNDDFLESLTEGLFGADDQSPEDHLESESSRDVCYVRVGPLSLVEMLMDVEQWSQVFCDIVSNVMMLGVLASNGVKGNYEGTLQVMKVEYYLPTPLVPSRESYITRYCKRISNGMWGVVDVSLERVLQFPAARNYRRRPSGCLIEEMPNGTSKVTWVEHGAVDHRKVHCIFEQTVKCGFAFSAKRWIETLARQYERSSSSIAITNPYADTVFIPEGGRVSLLKLAERMVRSFGTQMSASPENKWTALLPNRSRAWDPRLMAVKSNKDDLGKPRGTTIVFATSLGLPTTPPKKLFDFLRNEKARPLWDMMSFGQYSIEEVVHISTSDHPGNRVSLIQVKSTPEHIATFYLQESYTDSTGSYVVHAPLELMAASMILNGGNPELVAILPSGFVVHPDVTKMYGGVSSGSILTIAFNIIDSKAIPQYVPRQSLETMKNILTQTVTSIKYALAPSFM